MAFIAIVLLLSVLVGCTTQPTEAWDKPYSEELYQRLLAAEVSTNGTNSGRPDYLPSGMFARLPDMPEDFYAIRSLVRLGRIVDLAALGPEYWMQPEFFPQFEEIGVPLLQNPPVGRWGAFGILIYPADTVITTTPGEEFATQFFLKSGYLVETYQGINLEVLYPNAGVITTGVRYSDGTNSIRQDGEQVAQYFDVEVQENPFVLEPNFPVYNQNGTRMVNLTIKVAENTPPGKYLIGLDTTGVPTDIEQEWVKKYLTLYTSGTMTKLDRPYYQAFIEVR